MFMERFVRSLLFLAALVLGALGWGLVLTNATGTDDLAVGIFLLVLGVSIGGLVILAPRRRVQLGLSGTSDRLTSGSASARASATSYSRRRIARRFAVDAARLIELSNDEEDDDEVFERWRSDISEVERQLEVLYDNRELWNDQRRQSRGQASRITTSELERQRTRLYIDGQLAALNRAIDGDDRGISLDRLLQQLEDHRQSVTLHNVLAAAVTQNNEPVEVAQIRQNFEHAWDDGSGRLNTTILRRDRADLSELLDRTATWADASTRNLGSERGSTISFVDLDYAISHTTEIFKRYQQLLTGRFSTGARPLDAASHNAPEDQEGSRVVTPFLRAVTNDDPSDGAKTAPMENKPRGTKFNEPELVSTQKDQSQSSVGPTPSNGDTLQAYEKAEEIQTHTPASESVNTPVMADVLPVIPATSPPVVPADAPTAGVDIEASTEALNLSESRPLATDGADVAQFDPVRSSGLESAEPVHGASARELFLALGPHAEQLMKMAGARGIALTSGDFEAFEALVASYGRDAVLAALELAIEFRRYLPSDVRSILRAGGAGPRVGRSMDAVLAGVPPVPERSLSAYSVKDLA